MDVMRPWLMTGLNSGEHFVMTLVFLGIMMNLDGSVQHYEEEIRVYGVSNMTRLDNS
jgi:hypothetical protein